jgi:hypothetical protein
MHHEVLCVSLSTPPINARLSELSRLASVGVWPFNGTKPHRRRWLLGCVVSPKHHVPACGACQSNSSKLILFLALRLGRWKEKD